MGTSAPLCFHFLLLQFDGVNFFLLHQVYLVLGFGGRPVFVLFAHVNEVSVAGVEQVYGFVTVDRGLGDLVSVDGPPVKVLHVFHVVGGIQKRDHHVGRAVRDDDVHPVGLEDPVDFVERLLEPLAAVFGAQQAVDGALVQRHLRHHA